jgi:hypothetical protein
LEFVQTPYFLVRLPVRFTAADLAGRAAVTGFVLQLENFGSAVFSKPHASLCP